MSMLDRKKGLGRSCSALGGELEASKANLEAATAIMTSGPMARSKKLCTWFRRA